EAQGNASGVNDGTFILDQTRVQDQTPSPAPTAPPAPKATPPPKAPPPPAVDRIDLVNTSTGAIAGFPSITTGDLNKPGPFNDSAGESVSHVLQVHFHLSSGNSSALVPRRTIQRTSTFGSTTSKNPPDRPPLGGAAGPPVPGGFAGIQIGPDGPGSHEIQRPS